MKPAVLADHLAQCSPWPRAERSVFKRGALARITGGKRQAPAGTADAELAPWMDGWDAADRILEIEAEAQPT